MVIKTAVEKSRAWAKLKDPARMMMKTGTKRRMPRAWMRKKMK